MPDNSQSEFASTADHADAWLKGERNTDYTPATSRETLLEENVRLGGKLLAEYEALRGKAKKIFGEGQSVKSGKYSAKLTTALLQGHVIIDQYVPAERFAGKTITLGAWVLTDIKEGEIGKAHL